jgi:hypothetical protein
MILLSAVLLAVAASEVAPASLGVAHAAAGPTLKLDRLEVPPEAKAYTRFLTRALKREAKKLDWGAGTGSKIEYRFELSELRVVAKDGVLTVHCSAVGRLPRGRTAKSQLSFGGEPSRKRKLVERVLTIVARGVLTRLSEIERERRED